MSQGVNFYGNIRTTPVWAADFGGREHILALPCKLDPTQFTDKSGVPVVLTANAAQGATSIAVTAIAPSLTPSTTLIAQGGTIIKAGSVLKFGSGKFAYVTADVLYGATTIAVEALPTALLITDKTVYSKFGTEYVPSGTVLGRTFTERAAGTPFGPAASTDDEIYLNVFDVPNAMTNGDFEPYRPTSAVKENYLPDYATLVVSGTDSALMTKLRTIYQCFVGQD